MVVCLERGADLHMAQLMPLPLIQIGFTFLVSADPDSPVQKADKWVCVCVCLCLVVVCVVAWWCSGCTVGLATQNFTHLTLIHSAFQ